MTENLLQFSNTTFTTTAELVLPSNANFSILLSKLKFLDGLPINSFSVATNPLAKAILDALATSFLVQNYMKKLTILHCITRDQNCLALKSRIWELLL